MDGIFTTIVKISSKPRPFFWLNPLTTSLALYLGHEVCSSYFTLYAHFFFKALFPLGSFINSKVWLSCKDFISSCKALIDSLFYSLSIASSKLSGSPPSMNITYSSRRYFCGRLMILGRPSKWDYRSSLWLFNNIRISNIYRF